MPISFPTMPHRIPETRSALRRAVAAAGLLAAAATASAQMTPVGTWHMVDKKGAPTAEVTIAEPGGVISGRITQLLGPDAKPAARCEACTDDRKDQPLLGLEILRGAKKLDGKDVWEGGTILDPDSGRTYNLRLTPADGGRTLGVRGSIGPFGPTQTWVRAGS
jgi:uncharacterized protein (DUF2147 family)